MTLKYHEQRIAKRSASKTKGNVTLQTQSKKEKKSKERWNDNKDRRGYNN